MRKQPSPWFVYLVRCKDSSLYCGITNNVKSRLEAHNGGSGAKYIVPSRRPVFLVYLEKIQSKSAALVREAAIKKMPKAVKEELVAVLGA